MGPSRTFDVGIAEQHAVTFAAGLAIEGLKPFCCIYSTFLQRGYDQVSPYVLMANTDIRNGMLPTSPNTELHPMYLPPLPPPLCLCPFSALRLELGAEVQVVVKPRATSKALLILI